MTTTMQRDSVWGTSVSEEDGGRDRRLLRFVARHGCVSIEQVMRELGVGRTAAYRRVGACIEAGLLERIDLLREEPSLLRATRQGLRYVGLGGLRVAEISPGAVEHWLRCTTHAQRAGEVIGHDRVRTERELGFAELVADRPLASAVMGRLPNRKPRLHRPDLVLLREEGPIAIEVELSPKAPRRLEAIVRAWARTDCVSEVHYYCEPGQTRRAVERAVAKVRAGKKIGIFKALSR
jgi:DNA-binding Lrp family transcriptional regulator